MSGEGETSGDATRATVRQLQRLVLLHPLASRAFVRAAIAEGRAVAKTEKGEAWMTSLVGTPLFERARVLWEACSLNLIDEDEDALRPTIVLEAVLDAARDSALESALSRLMATGAEP
jgi:hypothetical protein